MNILVVEDDQFKFSKIADILEKVFLGAHIVHHDNVSSATLYLKINTPELIVLDMSLPSHPAIAGKGSPISMPTGGIEVILELRYLKKTTIPIYILTQYPDVEIEDEYYSINESSQVIKDFFGMKSVSVTLYDNESEEWVRNFVYQLENQ
jgi:CheY-like chemotaxis protein